MPWNRTGVFFSMQAGDGIPVGDGVPRSVFPYVHAEETGVKPWQRIRVEGRPASYLVNPARFVGYAIKACHPKRTAAADMVTHFGRQKKILAALAGAAESALPTHRVRLAMVGDLMWIRSGWQDFLDPRVLDCLNDHDAVLGNLETQVSTHRAVPRRLPVRYRFNSPPHLLRSFRRQDGSSTFSALSFANNHMLDFGESAARDTLAFLRGEGIPASGCSEDPTGPSYVVFDRGGIRFGFYAAAYGVNLQAERRTTLACNILPGVAPDDTTEPVNIETVTDALRRMDEDGVDFRIVSLHWGYEHEHYPEPRIMQTARDIVAAGADVILGHHPHVQQPLEVCLVNGYRNGLVDEDIPEGCRIEDGTGRPRKALVAYSLGNFVTAAFTSVCRIGMILSLVVAKEEDGTTDWFHPHWERVYNRPASRHGKRKTLWLGNGGETETIGSAKAQRRAVEAVGFLKELIGEF